MSKLITEITCRPYSGTSNTKAFIDLKVNDTLVIRGLALVEGKKGLFLSFPSKKGKDGKYYNSIYSLDKEWSELLQNACIRKYNECNKSQVSFSRGELNNEYL